ncbi:MAG: 50S ribosomal protein L10 [Saprospirales bacterium]|nr:50S ribosomal protein L10 [Saprospirales bacterium]
MTREEKSAIIEELKEKFENSPFFYITDSSSLTVEVINKLRHQLFDKGIEMRVVKNTLVKKALESAPADKNYAALMEALEGPTALMFTEVANSPARLIKEFRKDAERPFIKAAYIDSAVYIGDQHIDALISLTSKDELIGQIIGMLQSPMQNVVSALQSGGTTIMGLLKALEERGDGE